MSASQDVLGRFAGASDLLASVQDVVRERADGPSPPSWCTRRGWVEFLRALPDADVDAVERDGLAAALPALGGAVPASLASLAAEVTRAVALPIAPAVIASAVATQRASPRKRAQVAAFAALLAGLAPRATRVVDLGAGHGHLTRHLAHALEVDAEGWERDLARVAVAAALPSNGARFIAVSAHEAVGDLRPSDLVVGLHACGELGDLAVQAAVAAGAAVAVIGCCMQKRTGARAPLGLAEGAPSDFFTVPLTISRDTLGLANVRDGEQGIEADLQTRQDARLSRLALRYTLLAEGHADTRLAPGAEMRGINRRRASGSLEDLVALAFAQRGLPPPPPSRVTECARRARADYQLARRWELPRTMLGRLVEVWIALDRAALLARRGYRAEVRIAFDAHVSPRNLAVLGQPI